MTEQPIDAAAAARALDEVRSTRRRSAELRAYAGAGPSLIAWGVAWLVGNMSGQFAPQWSGPVWSVAIVLTVAFQVLTSRGRTDWRVVATVAAGLGFLAASVMLVGIPAWLQSAFASLVVAAVYVGLGIWVGARFAWLGLLLAAIILTARFGFPAYLPLWLGLGGGGALILSGLWLRRA